MTSSAGYGVLDTTLSGGGSFYGKTKKKTALILRKARLGKGFTQQYVAVNANTNIRAYQRLESGERDIGNASMRFGLSVCLILDLNPYTLVLGDQKDADEN